jgi:protein gp37
VIVGGESGHHARPMQSNWAFEIISDCVTARVPVFFKQGSQANWPDFKNFASLPLAFQIREWPMGASTTETK